MLVWIGRWLNERAAKSLSTLLREISSHAERHYTPHLKYYCTCPGCKDERYERYKEE